MNVFLAGGTGAVGRYLTPMLLEAGHEVTAISRSKKNADWLREIGAKAFVCDALDAESLRQAVVKSEPNAVINQLTDIPADPDPKRLAEQFDTTNRLRILATQTLLSAAEEAGVRRFVNQSVAFFYRPGSPDLATEDELLYVDAPKAFKSLVIAVNRMEHIVQDTVDLNPIVLRYGIFYGPGTMYDAESSFAAEVRRRRVPILGRGKGCFSFIHVRDAASAAVYALETEVTGCYNIVDDEPAPVSEWLPHYATCLGAKRPWRVPAFIGRWAGGPYVFHIMTKLRGASNELAREALGWEPAVPSWRDGFRSNLSVE